MSSNDYQIILNKKHKTTVFCREFLQPSYLDVQKVETKNKFKSFLKGEEILLHPGVRIYKGQELLIESNDKDPEVTIWFKESSYKDEIFYRLKKIFKLN